jgi:nucleoside-diphosphate-sugar epimerase
MKITVLGSQGLVGSNLVPRLQHKHEVLALDKVYDVRSELELPKSDLVINLASVNSTKESIENPREYLETNVVGNFNMLEATRSMGAKYMYLTSIKEVDPNPYGTSKHCASAWVTCYKETYNVPTILDMVGNLYGPGGYNSWVNIFMAKVKINEQITVFGDGTESRSMLYISDLADLLLDQVENFDLYQEEDLIPIGGGEKNLLSIQDLLQWLEYKKVKYEDPLPGSGHTTYIENNVVSDVHGWKPTTSLDKGLQLTWDSL